MSDIIRTSRVLGGYFGGFGIAVAPYAGPGDVISGATSWWGLRAYSLASVGTNAIRLREDGTNTEQDFATVAGGGLSASAIDTFRTSHGGTQVFVTKLYDQVSTKHFVQATAAAQPKLVLSGLGINPIMSFDGAAQFLGIAASAPITTQPYSLNHVTNRTATVGGIIHFGCNNSGAFTRYDPSNSTGIQAGTQLNVTASDGSWHSIGGLFSGASSKVAVDGASTTGNAGTGILDGSETGLGSLLSGGSGGFFFLGSMLEHGIWNSDISSNFAALSTNQHAYWGF